MLAFHPFRKAALSLPTPMQRAYKHRQVSPFAWCVEMVCAIDDFLLLRALACDGARIPPLPRPDPRSAVDRFP